MNISNKITENQYRSIVESSMVAVGILTLSRGVSRSAYHEGWISVILGGIYPIIVVLAADFIDKKMNGCSFEKINDKIYGKFLSKIILITFFIKFAIYGASILSGFVNVAKIVIIPFISPYVILAVLFFITSYATINGLTLVGRLCEVVSYLLVFLVIMMNSLLFEGHMINVKPLFSSFKNIISAVPNSLFSYTGVEMSYITIHFITNKSNPKKAGLQAVLFIVFTYASNVFVVIYCLGWEITSKNSYPILFLASTLEIPLIENLRTTLMVIWSFIIFRILTCDFFAAAYSLSKAFNMKYKVSLIITLILGLIGSIFMMPEYNRVNILDKVTPYTMGFGVLWGVITTIIIIIKNKKVSNNSYKKGD
ncbi:spore germination protein [Clostridium pascui]|uniref:GerAB/ArcD/ProY family transporter n=1 Tax=Clostridium pascui TaxID=46609 RepID=UPI00195AE7A1|nr:endospore germination permease [Clostridium pascui]MBM7870353.1 spore germination protein [Clostridium pascui]